MNLEFTFEQIETLRELINIGVGKGASILNSMLKSHIKLGVPNIKIMNRTEMISMLSTLGDYQLSIVNLPFKGSTGGSAKLIFPTTDANKLVQLFADNLHQSVDNDSMRIGTLSEIGNIVINSVMGSISNMLKIRFRYSVPSYHERKYNQLLDDTENLDNTAIVLAKTTFTINQFEIIGNLIIFFELSTFDSLIDNLNSYIKSIN